MLYVVLSIKLCFFKYSFDFTLILDGQFASLKYTVITRMLVSINFSNPSLFLSFNTAKPNLTILLNNVTKQQCRFSSGSTAQVKPYPSALWKLTIFFLKKAEWLAWRIRQS